MADESNTGPLAAVAGTEAEVKTPKAKKQRAPRRQKAVAVPVQAEAKATAAKSPAPAAKPRRYSEQERGEKLKLIGTQVTGGTSTLRDAIKNAGISEQTYYQWKRAAKAVDQKGRSLCRSATGWPISFNSKKRTKGFARFWRKSCARKMRSCARGSDWTNPRSEWSGRSVSPLTVGHCVTPEFFGLALTCH